MADLLSVSTEADLEPAFEADAALIYKHSPTCFASARAMAQVRRFAADHPDTPVYLIDVIRDRPLSRQVEARLRIRHESPQAILLRHGKPVWDASHYRVTDERIAEEVARLTAG